MLDLLLQLCMLLLEIIDMTPGDGNLRDSIRGQTFRIVLKTRRAARGSCVASDFSNLQVQLTSMQLHPSYSDQLTLHRSQA